MFSVPGAFSLVQKGCDLQLTLEGPLHQALANLTFDLSFLSGGFLVCLQCLAFRGYYLYGALYLML